MSNILTTKQDTNLVLNKSKSMINLTSKILSRKSSLTIDTNEEWMKNLWEWADKLDIHSTRIPRNRSKLSSLYSLELSNINEDQFSSVFDDTNEDDTVFEEVIFPREIAYIKSLKSLELDASWSDSDTSYLKLYNDITFNLRKLEKLKLLDLFIGNALTKNIINLCQIKEIEFHSNGLKEIATEIGSLTSLTKLSLHGNQLTYLPEEIGNLEQLTYLCLSCNQLVDLPKSIIKLKNIRTLSIDQSVVLNDEQKLWINKLIENEYDVFIGGKNFGIPVWTEELWQWCDVNNIGDYDWTDDKTPFEYYSIGVPRNRSFLLKFSQLNLQNEGLNSLTQHIGKLINLESLNLYNNNLQELPDDITKLAQLDYLDISKNPNLTLTEKQQKWIRALEKNNCKLDYDNDLFTRKRTLT
ncbi:MAG: hypothetical protein U9N59_09935 [Campylobacterota bacterium]|nr:hypothetical protein [Campylobacterota bacterium]